ncbi:MAG: endonuclease/exonuclease/phosphatase family protein [Candidatus Heimdallarchaeota archaeon]|nr:endonuclease/exonuclease/phosphatase family protein [Candidatus Heimdallarchaeota archaeon]
MFDFKKVTNTDYSLITLFSIVFLFFLQMLSDLVERIYAYALLNLEPDENILGLLFLLAPLLLLIFWKKIPNLALLISGELLILARLIEPLVSGQAIYIFAGISVGSFFVFFGGFLTKIREQEQKVSVDLGIGLAIAVAMSIFYRTANSTVDVSQYGWNQIIGWALGILASVILVGMYLRDRDSYLENKAKPVEIEEQPKKSFVKILGLSMGLFSIFVLLWFVFMSPTVISRWTEGNYIGIVIGLVLMLGVFIGVMLWKPNLINYIKIWMITIWNAVFAISLTMTVLAHQIFFTNDPTSFPLVAPATQWFHQIPLVLTILASPIIYLNFIYLCREIVQLKPKPSQIGGSFAIGGLFIIIMLFVQVLPNVWGYLPPISFAFRDQYWLAFFIPAFLLSASMLIVNASSMKLDKLAKRMSSKIGVSVVFGVILIGTITGAVLTTPRPNYSAEGKTSLTILTYNIQQGINVSGDWNYDGQLELIREINPDIIGLQECDPTRISGGNMDVVRFFASNLNMYSYYGPKTVTNTYGCAILSKFPISNALSFFAYSDEEQVGSAQAQITVGTRVFNVFVNHPSGDEDITTIYQAQEMVSRTSGLADVIYMGDFNFRAYSAEYNITIGAGLADSWQILNDIPAEDRIDHIFLRPSFTIIQAHYIEEGQSDHPAYWIEILL